MYDWFYSLIRTGAIAIDSVIYGFISTVYGFINDLANVQVINNETIDTVARNIYVLLAIFMIFRLSLIIIRSIVNPDLLTSNEEGVGKILSKVVISLILIVGIPYAFSLAYTLQAKILSNNIVNRIILGGSDSIKTDKNAGGAMGSMSLKAFITCGSKTDKDTCNGLTGTNETGGFIDKAFDSDDEINDDFNSLKQHINDTVDTDDGKYFAYDYKIIISSACGVFIIIMLISIAFDIAVRSVKLGFLQLMTPLAVVGYVEPKGKIFNDWFHMCISTYANLFARLATVSFITLIISKLGDLHYYLTDAQIENGQKVGTLVTDKPFVTIFIIMGLLLFAKEAPKLISDLLGIKEAGFGSLNPLKRLAGVPVAGAVAGGIGGAVAGAIQGRGFAGALKGGIEGFKGNPMMGGDKSIGKNVHDVGSKIKQLRTGDSNAKTGIEGFMNRIDAGLSHGVQTGSVKAVNNRGAFLRKDINTKAGRTDWGRGNKSNEQIASERAAANSTIFTNHPEFAKAYQDKMLADARVKDRQEKLTELQTQRDAAALKYQNEHSQVALDEYNKSQEGIRLETINVSEAESTAKQYNDIMEKYKGDKHYEGDVSDLNALESYDNEQKALERLHKDYDKPKE